MRSNLVRVLSGSTAVIAVVGFAALEGGDSKKKTNENGSGEALDSFPHLEQRESGS